MKTQEGQVRDKCENWVPNGAAFWLGATIRNERCNRPAKHIVQVNPPKGDNDGTVRLCDLCNDSAYRTFPRIEVAS